MKTALFIGFATASLLYGGEPVVVEPLGLAGRPPSVLQAAVVGGEPVKYELAVEVSAPASFTLYADIRQAAKDLMAPLQTNVPLRPEISLPAAGRRKLTVEIPIPEVKKGTVMVVDFKTAADQPSIAQAGFIVFPKVKPGARAEAVGAAAKAGGLRLAVFGESENLRAFFKGEGVTFEDLGVEFPETFRSGLLVLGEVTAAAVEMHRPEGKSGRAILFVPSTRVLPGVYETTTPAGSLTKVTLPLMAGLADNPQVQSVFLNLILQQLNPATSASTL